MTRKQRRLTLIGTGLATIATALGLVSFAMRDTIVFFHTPTEVQAKGVAPGTRFRLGGLVKEGSIKRGANQQITFEVVDAQGSLPVRFQGILPDLFREGQGVVALGTLGPDGLFRASEVLARHDETYMPPEVMDALKRSGHWNPEQGAAPPAREWNTLEPAAGQRSGG